MISHMGNEIGCLRKKDPHVGCRLLECNQSYRFSSDVIIPSEGLRLSLDLISLDTGYLKRKRSWHSTQVIQM